MRRGRVLPTLGALLLLASLVLVQGSGQTGSLAPSTGSAAPGQGLEITWWTIDGGGATNSAGGDYVLGGTAGQPDAGRMAGGGYVLTGGFWGGAPLPAGYQIYLPLVLRSP